MKKIIFTVIIFLTCALLILLNHSSVGYCSDEKPSHLVDKRVELVSLVFRLAGIGYNPQESTDYQMSLSINFEHLKDHPVVIFSRHSFQSYIVPSGIYNVLKFDGDLIKLDTELVNTTDFAMLDLLTMETFVDFLNCFFMESEFGQFFLDHYEYFRCHSERFISLVSDYVNYDWFLKYGLYEHNMNIILSPGLNVHVGGLSFCFTDSDSGETVVYAILPTSSEYILRSHLSVLIHEFVHPFANYKAYNMFWGDHDFREMMIRSHTSNSNHSLITNPLQLAREYITHAYTILYLVENTTMSLERLLYWDYLNGKTYIQEVYSFITDHNHFNFQTKSITDLSLPTYYLSDIESYTFNDQLIIWQFLVLCYHVDFSSFLIPNSIEGAIFGSAINDAFYVQVEGKKQLVIDLGCGIPEGFSEGVRMVYRINLNEL